MEKIYYVLIVLFGCAVVAASNFAAYKLGWHQRGDVIYSDLMVGISSLPKPR